MLTDSATTLTVSVVPSSPTHTQNAVTAAPTVTNTTVLCPQHFPLIPTTGREHCASLHAQIVHFLLLRAPFPTHITNHHAPTPKTQSQLGVLFLPPLTNSAMIWKEQPLPRASFCTNIVHTLSTLISVSRGLVGGHFLKLNNKQSLRQLQSHRAGWRVHSCYRHWICQQTHFSREGK